MSSVVLSGDSSGTVTLTVPSAAGTNTATLPAATGTVMVSGNQPAFSAYQGSIQSISASTWTKLQINTKEFDTANCYDASTNYRFTPNVAGYYQFNGQYDLQSGSPTRSIIAVYKNGSGTRANGNDLGLNSASFNAAGAIVSKLWYMNGSTDYVELYCYLAGGGVVDINAYFQGIMVRAA